MDTTTDLQPPIGTQEQERERSARMDLDQARAELASIRAIYGIAAPYRITIRTDALNRRIANLRDGAEARERQQGMREVLTSADNPVLATLTDEQIDAVTAVLSGAAFYDEN